MTRLAWALCALAVGLAVASIALAGFNGETPNDFVGAHHAIGTLDALTLPVVGALIVLRERRHLLAWLLLAAGVFLAVFNFAQQYAPLALGLTAHRPSLPGGVLASWLAAWLMVPGIVISGSFLVLLFPDGRLPSRRWRPFAWAGAVLTIVPTVVLAVGYWPDRGPALIYETGSLPPLMDIMFPVALVGSQVLTAVGVVSLIVRYRRSGTVQRQQIKWVAYGIALSIPLSSVPEAPGYGPYLEFLGTVLLLAGLAVGIFRYRLWEIDRLVNRTLVYGLLTVILGGGYALGVLVIGQQVSPGDHPSSLVVATTTLAAAAVFQPLRRRIQQAVDRRFYRRRYDAARTIDAFAAQLRQQVDLQTLTAELRAVVDQTMRPTHVTLWLRPTAREAGATGAKARDSRLG
jgi:hypothetical protein